MPELTQRMIDAGATFFDSNGIPTRPDGTPALEENQGGLLQAIAGPEQPLSGEVGATVPGGAFYEDPMAFKYNGQEPTGGYPPIFGPNAPDAGWFTLDDYYRMTNPRPPIPEGYDQFNPSNNYDQMTGVVNPEFEAYDTWKPTGVPQRFQAGSNQLSTNDWRLLPPALRSPDNVMINGRTINRDNIAGSLRKGQYGEPPFNGYQSGAGLGYPTAWTTNYAGGNTVFGYPGDVAGWVGSFPVNL